MKKEDIILGILTSFGIGGLFFWILRKSQIFLPFDFLIFFVFFPLFSLFCLYLAFLIGKRFLVFWQLAKFALVGGFFALIDLGILNSLMVYFKIEKGLFYTFFVIISFIIATILKYLFDKFWVFEKKEREKLVREFSSFFVITLISGVIHTAVADFITNRTQIFAFFPPLVVANVGKILGILAAAAWNFLGYKFIVFKK